MDIKYSKKTDSRETLTGKILEVVIQRVNKKIQRISFNEKTKTSKRWLFTLKVLATKRDRENTVNMLKELQELISYVLIHLEEKEKNK